MIDETPTDMPEPGDTTSAEPGAPSEPLGDLFAGVPQEPVSDVSEDGGLTYVTGSPDQDVTAPQPFEATDMADAPAGAETAAEPVYDASAEPAYPAQDEAAPGAEANAQPDFATQTAEPTPYEAPQEMPGYEGAEAAAGAGAYAAAYGDGTPNGEPVTEPAAEGAATEAPAGGMSKGTRRALMIGGLAAGLLVVLGLAVLAALFAFGMFGGGATPPEPTTAGGTGSATAQGAPAASGSPTEPAGLEATATVAVVTNADVYESRDPFEPLLDVLESTATAGTTSEDTSGSASTGTTSTAENGSEASEEESGTLTLVAVVTEDGVRKAKLTLDGTTYILAAGEQVGDTPWEVLEVGSDFAVMLFGDERITLTVGQGVSK